MRTLYPNAAELRERVGRPGAARPRSSQRLAERGIDFDELAEAANQPDADPFDLLCHVAFNAPLRTRRERAERLRSEQQGLLRAVRPGGARRSWTSCWRSTPSTARPSSPSPTCSRCRRSPSTATCIEIAGLFGGAEQLREAVNRAADAAVRGLATHCCGVKGMGFVSNDIDPEALG